MNTGWRKKAKEAQELVESKEPVGMGKSKIIHDVGTRGNAVIEKSFVRRDDGRRIYSQTAEERAREYMLYGGSHRRIRDFETYMVHSFTQVVLHWTNPKKAAHVHAHLDVLMADGTEECVNCGMNWDDRMEKQRKHLEDCCGEPDYDL